MSNYPDKVDQFNEKLNKNEVLYVIEETVTPSNDKYEGLLIHDNIVDSSVRVYTGSKLTGDKVNNFILSIPADTDWKRSIKIFSNAEKLYITYESFGDQVEAEDINKLQESMTATQTELDRYKGENDLIVSNTVNRVTVIENNKAEKTYIDSELLKKSDKVNTYTKSETDARIQEVIGAAPAALDTLQELGTALNNDPNFAATMTNELTKKVDKIQGKQLSTEDYSTTEKSKLAGIENGANKYIHPTTHHATMIVEDASHRFVSDTEKSTWNEKASTAVATVNTNGLLSSSDKSKLDGVEVGANNYIHPNSHPAIMITEDSTRRFVTNAEKSNWNAKASTSTATTSTNGLMSSTDKSKLDGIATSANNYVHPSTHPASIIVEDSTHRFVTDTEKASWNSKQNALGYTPENPTNKGKANGYPSLDASAKIPISQIPDAVVTQDKLGAAGYGDMMKNVYDSDGDGVVDSAESVPWSGVTGKPSSFPPSLHTHDVLSVKGDNYKDGIALPSAYDRG
ncbi:MAG TPA: hypothetical protein VNQ57_10750, partial [Ureibacillus sp.]|nr:hypothetical protein [Ureibacillus sp.]